MALIFFNLGLVEHIKNIFDMITNNKLLLFAAGVLSYPVIKYIIINGWKVSIKLVTYLIRNRQLIKGHVSWSISHGIKYISLLSAVFVAVKKSISSLLTKIVATKKIVTSDDLSMESIFPYGGVELKASYRKYMTVGLTISAAIHLMLISSLLIQNVPKEVVRVVRIRKYAELDTTKTASGPIKAEKELYFGSPGTVSNYNNLSSNISTYQTPFSQADLTYEGLLQTNIKVVLYEGSTPGGSNNPSQGGGFGGGVVDALSSNYKIVDDESQTGGDGFGFGRRLGNGDGLFAGPVAGSATEGDSLFIPGGFASDGNGGDNIAGGSITSGFGVGGGGGYGENVGLPTNIPITRTKPKILPKPEPVKREIKWEVVLDPIFDWVTKNSDPIGQICTMKITNNDPTAKTAKQTIKAGDETYELILASKEEKQQLTICLINLATNKFVMLFDQGASKQSSIYNVGRVKRNQNNEIISFSKSTYKNANDPEAQEFTNIFWLWANSVTGRE